MQTGDLLAVRRQHCSLSHCVVPYLTYDNEIHLRNTSQIHDAANFMAIYYYVPKTFQSALLDFCKPSMCIMFNNVLCPVFIYYLVWTKSLIAESVDSAKILLMRGSNICSTSTSSLIGSERLHCRPNGAQRNCKQKSKQHTPWSNYQAQNPLFPHLQTLNWCRKK